jgi:hypothetical protein
VDTTYGPITVDMWGWLQDGAEYQGKFNINNQLTYMYNSSTGNATHFIGHCLTVLQGAVVYTAYITPASVPVRLIAAAFTGDEDIWDFNHYQPNVAPSSSVFSIPSFCH